MISLISRHTAAGSCAILIQASQEQNFGDEGGKGVVIGTGYIQVNRMGVIGTGWECHWKCKGKD